MIPTLQSALSGLAAAERKAAHHAQEIVRAPLVEQRQLASAPSADPEAKPVTAPAVLPDPGEAAPLADNIVGLELAEIAYKASAKVVRTVDEMSEAILDALA